MEAGLASGILLLSVGLFLARNWLAEKQQWDRRPADFFYFIGLPYLTIISGLLSPRLLGLKGLENQPSLTLTTLRPELQRATTLLFVEMFLDSQILFWPSLLSTALLVGLMLHLARYSLLQTVVPLPWREVFYDGLHWAFYRAIAWFLSGSLFFGIIWGIVIVIVELILADYGQKVRPWQNPARLIKMMLLFFTALLFFYSLNLWLVWLFHGGVVLLMNRVGRIPGPAA